MRDCIIAIVCLCAGANAQLANTRFQSSFGQNSNDKSNFQNSGQLRNPKQYQPTTQNRYQQNSVPQNQYQSSQYQSNQYQSNQYQSNQYQSNQYQSNQYQSKQYQSSQYQLPASGRTGGSCSENGRFPVPGSCDRYVECINGTAEEKLCPDGLRFNPNVTFNVYPCQYPNEVPCLERSSLQEAQPTEQCPHQFGWYRLGDARNCSGFRNCVNGVGYDFTCPEGLAFSEQTYRCEWPDQVAECDAEAFLGFRCPAVPVSRELGPPTGYRFYRSDADCQKYFMCIDGKPRVLGCGGEAAFDDVSLTCVLADEVSSCPPALKEAAARSRELEARRQAEELAHNSLRT